MPHAASRRSLLSAVTSSSSRRRLARSSTRRVLRYHALTESSMSSTTGPPRNQRYIRVSQQRMTKLRWPENSIEHQNVHGRPSSSSSASICIRVYTREADFHKPEIYGGRVRDGLPSGTCFTARRHEVVAVAGLLWIYFVVCFLSGRISYFFRFICFERTRPTASTRQPCLMYLSTSTGVRTGYHYLISLSVRLSV